MKQIKTILAQITLLEGRDKCEFKLKKPLKFLTGRADCIPEDLDTPYISTKEEVLTFYKV